MSDTDVLHTLPAVELTPEIRQECRQAFEDIRLETYHAINELYGYFYELTEVILEDFDTADKSVIVNAMMCALSSAYDPNDSDTLELEGLDYDLLYVTGSGQDPPVSHLAFAMLGAFPTIEKLLRFHARQQYAEAHGQGCLPRVMYIHNPEISTLLAVFRPQAQDGETAVTRTFDVTDRIASLSYSKIRCFGIDTEDYKRLADGLPMREAHDGPFEVDVDVDGWLHDVFGESRETLAASDWRAFKEKYVSIHDRASISQDIASDNTLVMFIDTPNVPENSNGPKIRIYLNDDPIFENPTWQDN